jgi:5-formyltetrahydrofolate cyclo-ligase
VPVHPSPIDEEKRALRRRMRALRLVADQKQGPDAALGLIKAFFGRANDLALAPGCVVSGYWPIVTEIDVRPLMARLAGQGLTLALPVLVDPARPLVFRRWRPDKDTLMAGAHGTAFPPQEAPEVTPDVLLVPGLAFDAAGYRLGQGGGHFDRTLAALRAARAIIAIGVGYAVQRLASVPRAPHDQPMDWLLDEDTFVPVMR